MDLLDEMIAPKSATIKERKGKSRNLIETPVLLSKGSKIKYTFILDTYPESHRLTQISKYIENKGIKNNYQILYPLKIKAKK